MLYSLCMRYLSFSICVRCAFCNHTNESNVSAAKSHVQLNQPSILLNALCVSKTQSKQQQQKARRRKKKIKISRWFSFSLTCTACARCSHMNCVFVVAVLLGCSLRTHAFDVLCCVAMRQHQPKFEIKIWKQILTQLLFVFSERQWVRIERAREGWTVYQKTNSFHYFFRRGEVQAGNSNFLCK